MDATAGIRSSTSFSSTQTKLLTTAVLLPVVSPGAAAAQERCMAKRWGWLLVAGIGSTTACGREVTEQANASGTRQSSDAARSRIDNLRSRFRIYRASAGPLEPAIADAPETTFETVDAVRLRARVPARARGTLKTATVVLSAQGDGIASVEDDASKLAVRFRLRGTGPSAASIADGIVVYPKALSGADVVHRADADGLEDFVVFEQR
ncbi:MAG TPA: hypothetical protein VLT33_14105, partial [Labilithrix sp.]|nr:hypothetical protein [Labilithrix sp.]